MNEKILNAALTAQADSILIAAGALEANIAIDKILEVYTGDVSMSLGKRLAECDAIG